MNYKFNSDKKNEFEKWNYRQMLKRVVPFIVPVLAVVDFVCINNLDLPAKGGTMVLALSNVVSLVAYLIVLSVSIKKNSYILDSLELEVNEDCIVHRNCVATNTYRFSDVTKLNKSDDFITFYLKGKTVLSINCNWFHDSEKLKAELEAAIEKIKNH